MTEFNPSQLTGNDRDAIRDWLASQFTVLSPWQLELPGWAFAVAELMESARKNFGLHWERHERVLMQEVEDWREQVLSPGDGTRKRRPKA